MILASLKMIILPLFLLILLAVFPFKSKITWLNVSLLNISISSMLLIVMDWSQISAYLRPVYILLCLITLIYSYLKVKKYVFIKKNHFLSKIPIIIFSLIVCILFSLSSLYFWSLYDSTKSNYNALNLSFPLKKGVYAVMQGGMNSSINYHYDFPTQKYAIDFTKLTSTGNRRYLDRDSNDLESYPIYEETFYSPIDGTILSAIDKYPDNTPRILKAAPTNILVINHNDHDIILLHIKQHSLIVKEGEQVKVGQALGLVGNSGFTSEPHLHLHVAEHLQDSKGSDFLKQKSVPFKINNHFLKRNDLFYEDKLIIR